ncbi:MAG: ferrous iron transport protein A [bacterium]
MRFRWRWKLRANRYSEDEGSLYPCRCSPQSRDHVQYLSNVPVGQRVKVCCLEGNGTLVRRLAELGFIPGTEVKVIRRAPLNDPIEFALRGYLVSLRSEEARLVRVQPVEVVAEEEVSYRSSDESLSE